MRGGGGEEKKRVAATTILQAEVIQTESGEAFGLMKKSGGGGRGCQFLGVLVLGYGGDEGCGGRAGFWSVREKQQTESMPSA